MYKIKDQFYFHDNGLPIRQYYNQFDLPFLEVGKVYRQQGSIYWKDYKIVFIGEGVALGVEIANGNGNFTLGNKELFYADEMRSGFKYNDTARPCYRLQEITQ